MTLRHILGHGQIDETLRSVRIQGLHVHIDKVGAAISNFNRPIVIESQDTEYPFYFRGSACLLKFQDKFFVITCFHNIKDINSHFNDIFFQARLGGGMQFNIPLAKAHAPKREFRNKEDCFDLTFFEPDLNMLPERIECSFFDISKESACYLPVLNEPILACGFPLAKGAADYQGQTISRPAVIVDGRFERWSHEPHLFYCRTLENPAGGVADGFSGGGAFSMRAGFTGIETCFSGIVVRGGNDNFYAISYDFIRHSLRNIIDNS